VGLNDACRIFGDNIVAVESFDYSEVCVDKLVQHLLDVCNPSHAVLLTVPQQQQFKVYVCLLHIHRHPPSLLILSSSRQTISIVLQMAPLLVVNYTLAASPLQLL
jgi:fructose-1-phosphate kinase PfkB-like protein